MVTGYRRETITVVAKTYPECSRKYGCLVCTAGINDKGEWRRLYPIPWALFWKGSKVQGFQKFDVISVPVRRKAQDYRQESYEVNPYTLQEDLQVVRSVRDWEERRGALSPHVDSSMEALWDTKRSLGLVKPKTIQDFLQKERNRLEPGEELTLERIEQAQQLLLPDFEPELMTKSRMPPEPLPWIGYKFTCQGTNCRGHEMMCIDWEIQQLFRRYKDRGVEGFQKVKERAMTWMNQRDVYLVVGTTWRYASWMVIGLFYPPREGVA